MKAGIGVQIANLTSSGSQYGTTAINEHLLGLQKREYLAKRNLFKGIRKCLYLIFKA
jgi:hypothetical protein